MTSAELMDYLLDGRESRSIERLADWVAECRRVRAFAAENRAKIRENVNRIGPGRT